MSSATKAYQVRGLVPVVKNDWVIFLSFDNGLELTQLKEFCDRNGFKPIATSSQLPTPAAGSVPPIAQVTNAPPVCPKHGRPMRLSEKDGTTWYCSKKVTPGPPPTYCNVKLDGEGVWKNV